MVLGGGAGLLAVGLIDGRGLSGLFGRIGGRSLRRTRPAGTTREAVTVAPVEPRDARFQPLLPAAPELAYEPVDAPLEPLPARTPGRRDGKKVPAAYTAVEGSYRDVARVPVWRKLISLLTLLGILAVIGVVLAALAGATIGTIAELVDGAVG